MQAMICMTNDSKNLTRCNVFLQVFVLDFKFDLTVSYLPVAMNVGQRHGQAGG